jgi:hypothetical protein
MKNRPPDLKDADKVVIDEEIVGQRRSGSGDRGTAESDPRNPVRRPVLQPEVADGDGSIRRLLLRKRPRLGSIPP